MDSWCFLRYRTPDRDMMWNQEQGGQPNNARQRVCVELASLSAAAELPPVPTVAVAVPTAMVEESEAVVKQRSLEIFGRPSASALVLRDFEARRKLFKPLLACRKLVGGVKMGFSLSQTLRLGLGDP